MKRTINSFLVLIILLCTISGQKVSALTPPRLYYISQDFVRWINNKSIAESDSIFNESMYQKYIDTYKVNQDFILTPQISGAEVYSVCWGNADVSILYRLFKEELHLSVRVYPVKAYNKAHFPQNIAGDLERRYRTILAHTHENTYAVTDAFTGEKYMQSKSVEKKKLKLAHIKVDCVQEVLRWKNEKNTLEKVSFAFITKGMYIQVSADEMSAGQSEIMTQIMGEFDFKKVYTNPGMSVPKNRFIRKQSRIQTTLYNPTLEPYTHLKFYIYNQKKKRYQLIYREKAAKKNRKKQKVYINLNIKQCLKKGKKQLGRKKVYPVNRRKRYRYKIRVKVGKKYYSVCSTFRLR